MAYRGAIEKGFLLVKENQLLTNNIIIQIQTELEKNRAGFRTTPGTKLEKSDGEVVYIPPQDSISIKKHMQNLEMFINDDDMSELDPLIKMVNIFNNWGE